MNYARYTTFATEFATSGYATPQRFLSRAEQQAIAIHALLSDGEWHTAQQIGDALGFCSKRHVQNIMQAMRSPLGIISGQHGYRLR